MVYTIWRDEQLCVVQHTGRKSADIDLAATKQVDTTIAVPKAGDLNLSLPISCLADVVWIRFHLCVIAVCALDDHQKLVAHTFAADSQ